MLPLNRILHPTDFSACAEGALAVALDLAVCFGAALDVLHVLEGESSGADAPDGVNLEEANLDIRLHEAVNAQLGRFDRAAQERLRVAYRVGHDEAPASAIVRYAGTHGVGLIVMGTHGRHGVQCRLRGTVWYRPDRDCLAWSIRPGAVSGRQRDGTRRAFRTVPGAHLQARVYRDGSSRRPGGGAAGSSLCTLAVIDLRRA